MPEGVSRKPSPTRALILPEVPWLMPRLFMSRQEWAISLRNLSCFIGNSCCKSRDGDRRRVASLAVAAVGHEDFERQGAQRRDDLRIRRTIGDEMGHPLEIAD